MPAGQIPDGLTPDIFYTYQIVYLPDLTHRYGLKVKGGSGELRATLNIVNGWMFTGPGPTYLRDSFTGEKINAGGSAVSGILDSASTFVASLTGGPVSALAQGAKGKAGLGAQALTGQPSQPLDLSQKISGYAELRVYEPNVEKNKDGVATIVWKELTDLHTVMDRNVVDTSGAGGSQQQTVTISPATSAQVVTKVKQLQIADGTAGGAFTFTDANVDPNNGQITVALGTNGQTMGRTYTNAALVSRVNEKVCGVLTTLQVQTTCLVVVDPQSLQKISADLKP